MPWGRRWGYTLAPALVLLALCGVVWADCLDARTGRPGLIATASILALGAGYYALVLRRSSTWRLRDPTG